MVVNYIVVTADLGQTNRSETALVLPKDTTEPNWQPGGYRTDFHRLHLSPDKQIGHRLTQHGRKVHSTLSLVCVEYRSKLGFSKTGSGLREICDSVVKCGQDSG